MPHLWPNVEYFLSYGARPSFFLTRAAPYRSLGLMMRPATALAAVTAGLAR
jgi:hypothetical protein